MKDKNKYKFADYRPSTITFYNQEGYVLLKYPSLVVVDTQFDYPLAAGKEAQMADVRAEGIVVGSPLRHGAIADFDLASRMLQILFRKINGHRMFVRPKIAQYVLQ